MSETTSLPLPEQTGDALPEWVHLLPAGAFPAERGTKILRADHLDDIIKRSLSNGKIVLDENHSTDASTHGKSARAMGWIVEMQARKDGIWGRVQWTRRGRSVMGDQGYRAISPVLTSDIATGRITRILRAALTNRPDLSLTTLHSQLTTQEESVTYPLSVLRSRLGLPADADETAINNALDNAKGRITLHSRVAALAGLKDDASDDAVVTALTKQREEVTLHSTLENNFQKQIDALKADNARMAGEHFVEQAGRTKVITADLKGELITLHSQNPSLAEKLVASLPDAPAGEQVTLHGAAVGNAVSGGSADTKALAAVDAALGLTDDDLKKGGLA